jgi:hypothetical protein
MSLFRSNTLGCASARWWRGDEEGRDILAEGGAWFVVDLVEKSGNRTIHNRHIYSAPLMLIPRSLRLTPLQSVSLSSIEDGYLLLLESHDLELELGDDKDLALLLFHR